MLGIQLKLESLGCGLTIITDEEHLLPETLNNKTYDEFITERQYVYGQLVYSLSEHWSVGTYFGGRSSTRENIDLSFGIAPTVEYSFYPYSEFARREALP